MGTLGTSIPRIELAIENSGLNGEGIGRDGGREVLVFRRVTRAGMELGLNSPMVGGFVLWVTVTVGGSILVKKLL